MSESDGRASRGQVSMLGNWCIVDAVPFRMADLGVGGRSGTDPSGTEEMPPVPGPTLREQLEGAVSVLTATDSEVEPHLEVAATALASDSEATQSYDSQATQSYHDSEATQSYHGSDAEPIPDSPDLPSRQKCQSAVLLVKKWLHIPDPQVSNQTTAAERLLSCTTLRPLNLFTTPRPLNPITTLTLSHNPKMIRVHATLLYQEQRLFRMTGPLSFLCFLFLPTFNSIALMRHLKYCFVSCRFQVTPKGGGRASDRERKLDRFDNSEGKS
jgi:hypothetical protein